MAQRALLAMPRVLELKFQLGGETLTAWCGYEKAFKTLMDHICDKYNLDSENTLWFYPNKDGVIVLPTQSPADLLLETGESMMIVQRRQLQRPPLLSRALSDLGDAGGVKRFGDRHADPCRPLAIASSSSSSSAQQPRREADGERQGDDGKRRLGTPSRSPKRARAPSDIS